MSLEEGTAFLANVENKGVVGLWESKKLHVLHLGRCHRYGFGRRSLEQLRFLLGVDGDIRKWGQREILQEGR